MRKCWLLGLFACATPPTGTGPDDPSPATSTPESDSGSPGPTADTSTPGTTPTDIDPSDGAWDGCRSFDDCPGTELCLLSLGRCEVRSDWTVSTAGVFDFHPPAAAPGDWLVVDGTRLYARALTPGNIDVTIGGTAVSLYEGGGKDDTRLVVEVPGGVTGIIEVVNESGEAARSAESFGEAPTGVVPCAQDTPTAAGVPGVTQADAGPHAAGWVDLEALGTRVFYPAHCGSVRRPAMAGTWPLVGLHHGNGAGFIHYEAFGQHLASWGFVAIMPWSEHDGVDITQAQTANLVSIYAQLRDTDLAVASPVLAGVRTTADVALIGHSRGTARIEHLVANDADLASHTVAVVFLGAVDDSMDVPGQFLAFHATGDRQSLPFMTNSAYSRHPGPKYKVTIDGGNHSLFSDHKVWTGFLDAQPTIARRDQLLTVLSFALPLVQRAHGLDEPFASWLDNPPSIAGLEIEQAP